MTKKRRKTFDDKLELRPVNNLKKISKDNDNAVINNHFQFADALSTMMVGFHIPCGIFMIDLPEDAKKIKKNIKILKKMLDIK